MKTAKEICEKIELQKRRDFIKQVDFFINKVAAGSGKVKLTEYYYRTNISYDSHFNAKDFTEEVHVKLIELGYKIEVEIKAYEYFEEVPVDEKIKPTFDFLGMKLRIPFKNDYIKRVYKVVTKFVDLKVLTISACCGEE